ncbi:hypothetical protein [Saccharothrix coeruleofusca]|uniref:Uncharacterized protein n=1 Tax=Saccharothrix coeruleofusca TaxID=33919 RepID=A0A918EGS7_9PSEU|nr:hypothetical protein [Saccharothrix coeruleofusca]GGP73913.1 hypothetical protein GCM10010185_54250 [Saccharothrix coeruleofusca]
MPSKVAIFILAALVLVVGTAVVQDMRAAVFALLGCALVGVVLLLVQRSRSNSR